MDNLDLKKESLGRDSSLLRPSLRKSLEVKVLSASLFFSSFCWLILRAAFSASKEGWLINWMILSNS